MRFDELISRADDEVLQQLVGPPVVRLLTSLDPTLARPRRLRELVTSFRPAEELLRDKETRSLLLDMLPREDATYLAHRLELDAGDPYLALREVRIRKGSALESQLFAALAVVPSDDSEQAQAPSVESQDAQYSLFAHQRTATRQAESFLEAPPHRVLVHMPTGSGKTRTSMHLVARELLRREPCVVVWLAYSEELCEQAASEFEVAWSSLGDRPVSVYRYWGARSLEIGEITDGLVVAGLAKTYATAQRDLQFLAKLSDRATLVIIDEAHQAIAESYRFVLQYLVDRVSGTRLLGLTATPGRTWNEPDKDFELAQFFGRQKVTLEVPGYQNPIDYLIAEGYLAKPHFKSLPYTPKTPLSPRSLAAVAAALDVPEDVLVALAADDQRNMLIVSRIEQLIHRHNRILVFAATVDHARLLATVLRARGHSADAVTAQTAPGERTRLIARFKSSAPGPIVLCNYGVLTTGFDAPRTSAAVIARPTKSLVLYSQMVGRATRGPRAGGNAEAEIVTVVDTSLPGFGELTDTFWNWEDVW